MICKIYLVEYCERLSYVSINIMSSTFSDPNPSPDKVTKQVQFSDDMVFES